MSDAGAAVRLDGSIAEIEGVAETAFATADRPEVVDPSPRPSPSRGEGDLGRFGPATLYAILAVWLAIVVAQAAAHVPWRDEVRALSVATLPPDLAAMFAEVHREGHPLLWYLILRGLHALAPATVVLKVAAVTIAATSAWMFLRYAPFAKAVRVGFLLSNIVLFEYSIMARNYGISMLLMFAFAVLYRQRDRRPLLLGLLLFLLANTNVHAALLVPLFGFVWLADWHQEGGPGRSVGFHARFAGALGLAVAGVVLCALTIYPPTQDLAITRSASSGALATVQRAVLLPGSAFRDLYPTVWLERHGVPGQFTLLSGVLYALVFGLVARPPLFLAALGGLWGLALLFGFVYPGFLRHQAIWFVFMITLYWLAADRRREAPGRRRSVASVSWAVGAGAALPVLLLAQFGLQLSTMSHQIAHPFSMSRSVARIVSDTPGLSRAAILADPDYDLESISYYLDNPTYLSRQRTFGRVVDFTRHARLTLTLADILASARDVQAETGLPLLILLAERLDPAAGPVVKQESYAWTFAYDSAQVSAFREATDLIASLRGSLSGEDYDVYRLRPEGTRS